MSKTRHKDLKNLVLGETLGEGLSRKVYEYVCPITGEKDKAVIKYEGHIVDEHFQNVSEWEIWKWVRATPMAKWFAPCYSISPNGIYLVQARVEPLRKKEWPKKLPAFLVDLKPENLGLFQSRVVACDYGLGVSVVRTSNKRMVQVKW